MRWASCGLCILVWRHARCTVARPINGAIRCNEGKQNKTKKNQPRSLNKSFGSAITIVFGVIAAVAEKFSSASAALRLYNWFKFNTRNYYHYIIYRLRRIIFPRVTQYGHGPVANERVVCTRVFENIIIVYNIIITLKLLGNRVVVVVIISSRIPARNVYTYSILYV